MALRVPEPLITLCFGFLFGIVQILLRMGEQGGTELRVTALAPCAPLGPGAGTEATSEVRGSFQNAPGERKMVCNSAAWQMLGGDVQGVTSGGVASPKAPSSLI